MEKTEPFQLHLLQVINLLVYLYRFQLLCENCKFLKIEGVSRQEILYGGGRKRMPKFNFSAKFPIGLHGILQIQIKKIRK